MEEKTYRQASDACFGRELLEQMPYSEALLCYGVIR
jgi:hypothetical protein